MFQTNQRKTQNTAGKDSTHFLIPINYRHLAVEHNPPQKKICRQQSFMIPGGVEDGNVFFFQIFSRWRSGLSSAKFCGFAALWTHNCHPVPNEQKLPETLESPEVRPGWEFVPGPDGTVPYRYQCTTKKNGDTITIFVLCSNSQETMN